MDVLKGKAVMEKAVVQDKDIKLKKGMSNSKEENFGKIKKYNGALIVEYY